jgi:hypothetical protein
MASEEKLPEERARLPVRAVARTQTGARLRRSKKEFRVGKVTVYPRDATWWMYFREDKTSNDFRSSSSGST